MPRYATGTEVPVEQSRAEIESTVRRYGATEFQSGWKVNSAMVQFCVHNLSVRFILPFPDRTHPELNYKKVRGRQKPLTDNQKERAFEQQLRSRWRALLLVIKAKLEATECGISTLEREFLANVVLPNDELLGDWLIDSVVPLIQGGKMPRLLEGPKPAGPVVIDAEVVGPGE